VTPEATATATPTGTASHNVYLPLITKRVRMSAAPQPGLSDGLQWLRSGRSGLAPHAY
jgi:hypothetical protein